MGDHEMGETCPGSAESVPTRYDTPTGEHPALVKMREGIARCVERGYTEGDVNHNTQPIIGMLRLRLRDGKALTPDEMEYAVTKLRLACDAETAWLNTPTTPADGGPS